MQTKLTGNVLIERKSALMVQVFKNKEDIEKYGHGYRFLISSGPYPYIAFETYTGMKAFLKRNGMKLIRGHWAGQYFLNKDIEEITFWSLSEIENQENVKSYYDLSNGSLVTCYYEVFGDFVKIYRPNPNAKNVYNPLPIYAHIEHQKIYG